MRGPRCRPDCVPGVRGYDAEAIRQGLRAHHIVPWLASRHTEHGSGLGRWRWVVERSFACELDCERDRREEVSKEGVGILDLLARQSFFFPR
jgi:hypothetical protein